MKYRTLGSSGISVSSLGLGTMYFGDETPENEAFEILDAFVEAGGNLIDSADVYLSGLAERVVGRWISSRPGDIVDGIVIATKGRNMTGAHVNDAGLSRRHLSRALDASLKRLYVDTIDLYQLHSWDPLTPVEETLRFLDDAVRAGKIHYIGLSNFTGWQLQLMLSTAKEIGLHVPISLQQQYSLLSRESEYEVIPAASHNGIGLLPWSPLAGGFLAGKYQRGEAAPSDSRSGSNKPLYQWISAESAQSDRTWEVIEAVKSVAKKMGASPAQVSLAWVANRPSVAAPIIGARTMSQLNEALGSVDLALDAASADELSQVSTPICGTYPYGVFGSAQRTRFVDTSAPALKFIVGSGADSPLSRA